MKKIVTKIIDTCKEVFCLTSNLCSSELNIVSWVKKIITKIIDTCKEVFCLTSNLCSSELNIVSWVKKMEIINKSNGA